MVNLRENKRVVCSVFVLAVLLGGWCVSQIPAFAAESKAQTVGVSEYGLTLPEGWVRIPQSVIESVSKQAKDLNPNVKEQSYELGFQQGSGQGWFTYPYGLLQINRSGRLGETDLEKLPTVENAAKDLGKKLENAFEDVISSLEIGQSVFDSKSNIVWTQLGGVLAGVGEVKALSGTVLTSFGGISIYCYAKGQEYERYRPMCEQIIRSVEVTPEYRYR